MGSGPFNPAMPLLSCRTVLSVEAHPGVAVDVTAGNPATATDDSYIRVCAHTKETSMRGRGTQEVVGLLSRRLYKSPRNRRFG